VINSLSNPHPDLPHDTEILAQLIIDETIFLQTVPVEKDAGRQLWTLEVDCKMLGSSLHLGVSHVAHHTVASAQLELSISRLQLFVRVQVEVLVYLVG
jgi:hypothetical protein